MDEGYSLVARDKPALLVAMMRALAGDAAISFEGDLSRCRGLYVLPRASSEETRELRRGTLVPRLDFVVFPLERETIRAVLDEVLPEGRILRDVVHVQISKNGQLQFGAYDHFHPACVVCGTDVSEELLRQLGESGVLRSWRPFIPNANPASQP